jgi:maltose alpha-D-glucosyltransferase/alpha-amylase
MIFAFSLTMPGIPFIYYGNEIGMRQLYDLPQVEGAYKPRAGARTPMQWNSSKNLGFSTAAAEKLYLPVDTSAGAPTVEIQQNNPNSLLNKVRQLIKLRKTKPALAAYAEFVPVYALENTYPLVFVRAAGKETVLAVFNPADRPETAQFKLNKSAKRFKLLAGDQIKITCSKGNYTLGIPAVSYALYLVK